MCLGNRFGCQGPWKKILPNFGDIIFFRGPDDRSNPVGLNEFGSSQADQYLWQLTWKEGKMTGHPLPRLAIIAFVIFFNFLPASIGFRLKNGSNTHFR